MLNTRKFLIDEMSGQFYAVYGNSYQRMSTKPMLQWEWATGELIDELAATRQAFRYTGLAGSTPPLARETQPTASTLQQPDDLLPRQLPPKTVQYQPPLFRLTRPMTYANCFLPVFLLLRIRSARCSLGNGCERFARRDLC